MFDLILICASLFIIVITILMCKQESKRRKVNFFVAILICILITPLFGFFVISSFKLRTPIGCKWCGNEYNEAEFCGICKKNELGNLRPF
jgi:glucan phosphoethanolaminetransferase (alkaline phosphatase superfamily)